MISTRLLNSVSTLAVVCTQWGDTGKGKFIDFFAEWADIIARGTGGANAGHTIKLGSKTYVFHLVPSGILRDGDGKVNVIGNGVAFDPGIFCEELAVLEREGVSFEHLKIAQNARLVLPQHILLDRLRESSADGRIGTTGRGIGPTYVDHYARVGLTVNDLLNIDSFVQKLRRNLAEKRRILKDVDPEMIRRIMHHEHLEFGAFWSAFEFLDADAIVDRYRQFGSFLHPFIWNTDQYLWDAIGKKRVLLEGAQGNLLSVDHGTYPYVTSSDCSVQGLARGVGIRDRDVDLALGIVKAFYMTRVGEGPFPTELGGETSARWCNNAEVNEAVEIERLPYVSVNDIIPFRQGVAIRRAGNEYGATTKRPRRVGWLDLPLLRYSKRHTGGDIILTKLDVLDQCDQIKICTAYRYDGLPYAIGERVFTNGDMLDTAVPNYEVLQHCTPQYETFSGWKESTTGAKSYSKLPANLRFLVRYVACAAGLNVVLLSVGPDRDQTIPV